MENIQSAIAFFKILVHTSPVVMGAIVYFVLTSFMEMDAKLAAIIAFAFAVVEWGAFSMVLKKLSANED